MYKFLIANCIPYLQGAWPSVTKAATMRVGTVSRSCTERLPAHSESVGEVTMGGGGGGQWGVGRWVVGGG